MLPHESAGAGGDLASEGNRRTHRARAGHRRGTGHRARRSMSGLKTGLCQLPWQHPDASLERPTARSPRTAKGGRGVPKPLCYLLECSSCPLTCPWVVTKTILILKIATVTCVRHLAKCCMYLIHVPHDPIHRCQMSRFSGEESGLGQVLSSAHRHTGQGQKQRGLPVQSVCSYLPQ